MKQIAILVILTFTLNTWAQLPGGTTKPTTKADPKATQFGAELTLKDTPITVD